MAKKINKDKSISTRIDAELDDGLELAAELNGKKKGTQIGDILNVYWRGHGTGYVRGQRCQEIDFDPEDTVEMTIKVPRAVYDIAKAEAHYDGKNVHIMFVNYLIDAVIGHKWRLLKKRGRSHD